MATQLHEVPAPESVPPLVDPDPQPGEPLPPVPPGGDAPSPVPVKLPGQPGAPERV